MAEYLHIHYFSKVKARCNEATTVPATQAILILMLSKDSKPKILATYQWSLLISIKM